MNNKFFLGFSAVLILLNLVACQLPGQAPPMPTIDMPAVETSRAGTAQALAQTQAAYTPTPIPPTSTPPISPISGTSLAKREDGTFIFMDHRAGIQLTVPADWLPVRINEDEYYKAFTLDVVTANPLITDRLTRIQSNDIDTYRLDMIGTLPEHTVNGILSIISVIFEGSKMRTFDEILKLERAQRPAFDGFKYIGSKYDETANGTRVLIIEKSWNSATGGTVYYRRVFFTMPTGTVALDLQVNAVLKEVLLLELQQVMDSLTPINP